MSLLLWLLVAQAPHPCMADAKKLCPGVAPGEGRVAACLKQHEGQLSPECIARRDEFHEEAQACGAAEEKLCPDTPPGLARSSCVRERLEQLSAQCRDFFLQTHERRGEMRACRADAEKFCKGVKRGEGRILRCLQPHRAELSPGCASEIR
jgi:hypothetical protein